MKRNILADLGFYFNLGFIGFQVTTIILLIVNSAFVERLIFDSSGSNVYTILVNLLALPTFAFVIYNIVFFYRYDRYSGNGLLLFFFNGIYAPIYYYRVQIKGRPLKNEVNTNTEPVINNTIILEEYEDDEEYKKDL